jgi:hypothetical protein
VFPDHRQPGLAEGKDVVEVLESRLTRTSLLLSEAGGPVDDQVRMGRRITRTLDTGLAQDGRRGSVNSDFGERQRPATVQGMRPPVRCHGLPSWDSQRSVGGGRGVAKPIEGW